MCVYAEQGIQVTPEKLAEYNASKHGRRGDVSFVKVPEPDLLAKPFSFRSLGGEILHAFGLKKDAAPVLESVKVATRKMRKRIFAQVDIEKVVSQTPLGTMEDIDKALKPEEEK